MKLSSLIDTLDAIKRAHGDIGVILYDGKNDEWDIDHVDIGWSRTFNHFYAVVCTGNHEEGSEPSKCRANEDPPERDEPVIYNRGELVPRDCRGEHDRTL